MTIKVSQIAFVSSDNYFRLESDPDGDIQVFVDGEDQGWLLSKDTPEIIKFLQIVSEQ